jgi:hypothetical protein
MIRFKKEPFYVRQGEYAKNMPKEQSSLGFFDGCCLKPFSKYI